MSSIDTKSETLHTYSVNDQLLDGSAITVRAIRPDDKQALIDGLHRMSPQSSYLRFFFSKHDFSPQELVYYTEVDFKKHIALVAALDEGQLVIGVGRYIVCDVEPILSAEIAFAVDDAHHGLGVATVLLRHLAKIARAAKISEFRASVLAENHKMLEVFTHSGIPLTRIMETGVIDVRLSLVEPIIA